MTHRHDRARDRAVRDVQRAHPGMSLSQARRALPRQRAAETDAEAAALLAELRKGRSARRPPLMPLGGIGGFEGEVTVDLDGPLLGRPLRDTRDLLRRGDSWGLQVRDVQRALNLTSHAARDFLARLVTVDLLTAPDEDADDEEQPPPHDSWDRHRDYRTWTLTAEGHTLAHASGRTPTTRHRADALAAKVAAAAAAVNDDPEQLYWVKQISAVGAYGDPRAATLLHVDLAVDLRPRLADPAEQAKAERRLGAEARDRQLPRALDVVGYGHWQTRLALAGRSKVVRLFHAHPDVPGQRIFHETRDLTVACAPTPAYRPPAEPRPARRCSWCRRSVPATRVAHVGEPTSSSSVALCELCLPLARASAPGAYGTDVTYAVYRTLEALRAEPFHATGCALCGNDRAQERSWWPEHHRDEQPVALRLCDICPGLLELADRPDRPAWWRARHEHACLTGLHHRLGPAAAEARVRPARSRPPRLTDEHQRILDALTRYGALSPLDLSRRSRREEDDTFPYKRFDWWIVRFRHLRLHELVATLHADEDDPANTRVRLMDPDERDLRRRMRALFVPGPIWDGERVLEPQPPDGRDELAAQLTALTGPLDHAALHLRAAAFDSIPS